MIVFRAPAARGGYNCGFPRRSPAGLRSHLCRLAKAKGEAQNATISEEQIEDMSGVLSRVMIIPGVPDFAKMELVKSGMQQVAGAVNSDALPPELRSQLRTALGDRKLSEELGGQLTKVISPMVDIPLVPREQKEEVVKNIISFLIVQKEQENLLYFAMKGTYVGSAKFAYTTGREMLNAAAALRSKKSRQQLAKKLSKQMSLPFLSEDMGLGIVQAVVDALGDLVLSKVPARALEAAVSSGKEQEVQEFLTETLVGSDLQIPFMDTEQRRTLASQVVDAWLGSVDREAHVPLDKPHRYASAQSPHVR
eukprot:s2801_g6.t2